jgi:hypothetical protein
LHETHDFEIPARSSVHGHFDECYGADADMFEVIGISGPRFILGYGFLGLRIVIVQGIAFGVDQLYVVVEL